MDSGNTGPGQQVRRLKRGELLFKEGEKSRAMYLLKAGMIRLFMRRGDSNIEIDTIYAGQILGELAFLDGNPRSVSGEALSECELVEISGPMFLEVLGKAPEWLKILLKTVVGRLRAANTRIRQLEASNTALDYSDKDGSKRSASYQYLTYLDVMKVFTSLLLVGARNGKTANEGIEVRIGLIKRYANNVMGVPVAKVASVLDMLTQNGHAATTEVDGNPKAYLKNLALLEEVIEFLAEQNQLDATKRHEISVKGLRIMGVIAKHIPSYLSKTPLDPTEMISIDVGAIRKTEGNPELFRNEDLGELVLAEYLTELQIKSLHEVLTKLNPDRFLKAYKGMQIVAAIKAVNEQKRTITK